MPFDGMNFAALERIDAVLALLGDERQWCKGALFTGDGQMCLAGALRTAQCEAAFRPLVLHAAADATGRRFWTIESFNDHRSTSHAVLMDVLHRVREDIACGRRPIALEGPAPAARWRSLWQGLRLTLATARQGLPWQQETATRK
jgi:hypothetical protein